MTTPALLGGSRRRPRTNWSAGSVSCPSTRPWTASCSSTRFPATSTSGLLLARHATVTYCHSRTTGLPDLVAGADVVVAAVGKPELVRGEWIKPGAVVVDAGYNTGNVEYVAAWERASLITPVPDGVGPMTIAVLLVQTVDAAETRVLATPGPDLLV